jgi:hypothetical protein
MTSDLPAGPAVVGTIHSPAALREALRLRKGEVDLLEVRIDHFVTNLKALAQALPKLAFPLIITVRDPQEGGAAALSGGERVALYRTIPAGSGDDRCRVPLGAQRPSAARGGAEQESLPDPVMA